MTNNEKFEYEDLVVKLTAKVKEIDEEKRRLEKEAAEQERIAKKK